MPCLKINIRQLAEILEFTRLEYQVTKELIKIL